MREYNIISPLEDIHALEGLLEPEMEEPLGTVEVRAVPVGRARLPVATFSPASSSATANCGCVEAVRLL